MTPDLTALARALVALPGWTWGAGMLACCQTPGHGRTIDDPVSAWTGIHRMRCREATPPMVEGWKALPGDHEVYPQTGGWWPDLLDASTGGILLDRLGPDYGVERYGADSWCVFSAELDEDAHGPSLASACARAMVARGRA